MRFLFFFVIIILWKLSFAQNCQSCHKQIESNCNMRCQDCHLTTKRSVQTALKNHPPVIKNPSTEEWWQEKCESCHQTEIDRFKQSLHYSVAGLIDQTRYLFGKNKTLFETTSQTWKALKEVRGVEEKNIAGVVDHLLASKCLGCHFAADRKMAAIGRKHAAGCASCHVELDQQTGQPLHGHRFQKKISDQVCLSCHSGNRVGADYYGYFEHDYHNQYNTPYGSKPRFAAFQHRLQPDVHLTAGLHCVDCHREHVKRTQTARFEGEATQLQCQDCHGGFSQNAILNGKKITPFSKKTIAHQNFHQRVRCSACHAQWSFQDYGLHLYLEQSNNYDQWADYLWQGDGEVNQLLQQQLPLIPSQRELAFSINKLSGRKMAGIWFWGWTFRRWEDPILGVDSQNKISIIRPHYQYFVTFVDSLEQVWLDSRMPLRQDGTFGWNWDAYVPHTIGKRGRNCESCHLNPKALGLGIRQNAQDEVANTITVPQHFILPNQRALNKNEQKKLLSKSTRYRHLRAKILKKYFKGN